MEITEIRIKLMEEENERLQGFCSITLDNMFVIRDLKIIEGNKGCFIAMPSRKLMDRCPHCRCKNHLRARYCNGCGRKLSENRVVFDANGRPRLHADIAHPINAACREFMQSAIIKAYQEELERARQPGYVCRYEEIDISDYDDTYEDMLGTCTAGGPTSLLADKEHAPSAHGSAAPEPRAASGGSFGSGVY
ncbi:MAG: stage V sporulation protein G [Gemmataceae bacterium]